jgi:cytochrome bd-type quinol oxidase subunit 2
MRIHPLLRLAASEPHLLGEHVEGYAALFSDELKKAASSVAVRIGLYAGAGFFALVGLVWVGIALMLRATVPSDDYPAAWELIVVPLVPFLIGAVMVFIARAQPAAKPFEKIKGELDADLAMWCEVNRS